MTLLITVFAAIFVTVKWYTRKDDSMQLGMLIFMLWGASIMWLVDAIFEYTEMGADYFAPSAKDMLNDSFLGLAVLALALIAWLIRLLVTDPKGVVRDSLRKQAEKSSKKSVEV